MLIIYHFYNFIFCRRLRNFIYYCTIFANILYNQRPFKVLWTDVKAVGIGIGYAAMVTRWKATVRDKITSGHDLLLILMFTKCELIFRGILALYIK